MRALKRSPATNWILGASLFCIAAGFALVGQSAANSEPRIGRKIENFTLEDYRGRKRSLSDWADSKLVVVAFLGTECPLANLYVPRMTELAADFESKGVAFVGINANQQDSITEVAAHAQRHQIPFPIMKDPGNTVADAFGAVPHARSVRAGSGPRGALLGPHRRPVRHRLSEG